MTAQTEAPEDTGEDVITEIPPRTIRFPAVEWNSETHDEITLKPLSIGLMLDSQKKRLTDAETAIFLIVKSSGVPDQVVRLLDPRVIEAASKYFERFFPAAPKAAGTVSPDA